MSKREHTFNIMQQRQGKMTILLCPLLWRPSIKQWLVGNFFSSRGIDSHISEILLFKLYMAQTGGNIMTLFCLLLWRLSNNGMIVGNCLAFRRIDCHLSDIYSVIYWVV